jgi:hypothetical protein
MCHNFGQEMDPNNDQEQERKQKGTANDKFFCPPWCTDNFTRHLMLNHGARWKEYKRLCLNDKMNCFVKNESSETFNLRSFCIPPASSHANIVAKQKCTFVIDKVIVDDIIGDLLFDLDLECPDHIEGGSKALRGAKLQL